VPETKIRPATEVDMERLFGLILELAEYEKLTDAVAGDPEVLRRTLFEQRAAEALMEHIAALALERGHVRLEWTALDWNEPALRFYEKLGATKLGDWVTHRLDVDGMRRLSRS
jgi:GNAT superfamily N-acetyltransferase